jgi:hypothetical protein
MSEKEKTVVIVLVSVGIGFIVGCVLSALTNIEHVIERKCDNTVYYPNGQIVCEVYMHSQYDQFKIEQLN